MVSSSFYNSGALGHVGDSINYPASELVHLRYRKMITV